ncbi:hypothetical protein ACWY4P_11475 [Streptomyces sp. LZ34]
MAPPLIRANRLLADCEFLLQQFDNEREIARLLADVRQCCDEAEEAAVHGDAEAAATIAVLRSMAATFALRHAVLFHVNCDFDDDDGTLLGGMESSIPRTPSCRCTWGMRSPGREIARVPSRHRRRRCVEILDANEGELDEGELGEGEEKHGERMLLQIHRPGRRIAEYNLNVRMQAEPGGKALRIDWSGIPVDERLESPLPPGRPLRVGGRTRFSGAY